MGYSDRHLWSEGSRDLDAIAATTVVTTFAPINRCLVHKVGLRIITSQTGTGSIGFSRRRAAATDTLIATITLTASQDGKLLFEELTTPSEFLPGDVMILVVAADSGTSPLCIPCMEYSIESQKLLDVGAQAVSA